MSTPGVNTEFKISTEVFSVIFCWYDGPERLHLESQCHEGATGRYFVFHVRCMTNVETLDRTWFNKGVWKFEERRHS